MNAPKSTGRGSAGQEPTGQEPTAQEPATQESAAQESAASRPKRGLRRVPVGIWLLLALAVIVGAGFLLFGLASATGTGSTAPTTSTIVLPVVGLLR